MRVKQEYLNKIIDKSSTVSERLQSEFLPENTPENERLIDSRMEAWCKTVAGGNKDLLEKRFAWDKLDLNLVRNVLGSGSISDIESLPDWAEILKDVLEATPNEYTTENDRCLDLQEPLPFEELFLPFIKVAREKLQKLAASHYYLCSDLAHKDLERDLLENLSLLCSQVLGIRFQVFRHYNPQLINRIEPQQDGKPQEIYKAFINELLKDGLLNFLQEYAVLARLLATTTTFWVNNNCQFLQHLASDFQDIQKTFAIPDELGKVVAIKPSLSDSHHNGKTVISITFACGLKLIYKPKDLGMEAAYFQFLSWLNEQEIPLQFKIVKVINRSTYGWVEYVEHLPCSGLEAGERYYKRAGMLLCLLYVLEATDCHNENIIACGEHPVLIDTEMLLTPRVREVDSADAGLEASYFAMQHMNNSVLRSSLLPTWETGADGSVYDISGIGGIGGQETHYRVKTWKHINTDKMEMSYEYVKTSSKANIPFVDGVNKVNLLPGDYVEQFVDGFRHMYNFFVVNKEVLLADDSPLKIFAREQVRFIFRPTKVYAAVQKEALQPKYLRNGIEYSIALDVIYRPQLQFEDKPHYWKILEQEKQALTQLDVPLLLTHCDSDSLTISTNCQLEKYFTNPSYELVSSRLQQLNEQDLDTQINFIRASLYGNATKKLDNSSLIEEDSFNIESFEPLSVEALVQEACYIAQQIQEKAMQGTDGSVTWMGLQYILKSQRFLFSPMGSDLYDGTAGVALFLAAVEKVTGGTGFRELAVSSLQAFHKFLHHAEADFQQKIVNDIGIGGAKGLGSLIYTLVQTSSFLNEPMLLEDAQKAVSFITADVIAADKKLDTVFGASGAILGLLALHKVTNDPQVLEIAIACGHHLLNNRKLSTTGYQAWPTIDEKLLTGFSHGAAGIAYSLLKLYAVTKNSIFLDAAKEGIAYENSVFSSTNQNWPDYRYDSSVFGISWCHGAPGIGLARLGGLEILDTPEIRQDIEKSLEYTQQIGLQGIDHLCCGNFGRMETLLIASRQFSRPEMFSVVQKQAAALIQNAKKTGNFQISSPPFEQVYNPSFFSGVAGVGYQLLRLAYPDILPSVLLWQN
ncbi:MAG: type 2 lantipeptide synthetase LanM family protein [Scytonematopsis contorta HA4267-MV1]|jgi:type 2 lantibiotic biosynthesis protein LanM|nr:type 2 lantipeptide synthetase LanM family protein [Scytonematopsis contorta HA4267-MV1]